MQNIIRRAILALALIAGGDDHPAQRRGVLRSPTNSTMAVP
jgi:hypothetical protein